MFKYTYICIHIYDFSNTQDCTLTKDVRKMINLMPESVHLASTSWQDLERSKFDKISEKGEGMYLYM
jgi:hypothetical protein